MGVKNGSDFDFNNNDENEINHHQNQNDDHCNEEELILPSVRRMATLFQDDNPKNKTLKPRRMDLNCDTSELVGIFCFVISNINHNTAFCHPEQ